MNDNRDPRFMPGPTSEESRELFIARHFVALFFLTIAAGVALLVWFLSGFSSPPTSPAPGSSSIVSPIQTVDPKTPAF